MTKPLSFGSDGKLLEFTPQISDISGLQTALDGKAAASHTQDWSTITGKPSTFTPASHVHAIADVTSLQTALDGKAAASHTQDWSTITGAPTTRVGYGITDAAGLGANTFSGAQVIGTDPGGSELLRVDTIRTAMIQFKGGSFIGRKIDLYADTNAHMGLGIDLAGGPYELSLYGSSGNENQGFISFGFVSHANPGTYSQKMRLNADGSLHIGTDPGGSELLRVGGSVRLNGALWASHDEIPQLGLTKTGVNTSFWFNNGSTVGLWDATNGRFAFGYKTSDGSITIGTDPGGSELLRVGGGISANGNLTLREDTSGANIKLKYSTTYSTSINTNNAGGFFVQDDENTRIFLNYDRSINEVRIGPDLNIRFKTGLFHLRGGTPVATYGFGQWTGSVENYQGLNQESATTYQVAQTLAALIKVLRAQGVIGSS